MFGDEGQSVTVCVHIVQQQLSHQSAAALVRSESIRYLLNSLRSSRSSLDLSRRDHPLY